MIKIKLWFCLITLALITACIVNTRSTNNYALVVEAWRGKLLFAHRVIYGLNEYGASLNLDIPKEKELGYDFKWSPDGQWIAHSYINPNARTASDRDIYIIRADGNNKSIRLTNISGTPDAPVWSPDGARIVFHAYAPDDNNHYRYGIYLLNIQRVLRGENCTPEPTFLVEGINPDWSPDGEKIVYQGGYGSVHGGIYVVDVQNPSEPIKLGECDGSPQWSPDGTKIVSFCKGKIQIIDPNGNNVVKYAIDGFDPKWSPDGTKIAFIGTETLDSHLGEPLDIEGNVLSSAVFIMDANGTNINRVTRSNEETIRWFTWTSTENIK